jgi:hypothetical protein
MKPTFKNILLAALAVTFLIGCGSSGSTKRTDKSTRPNSSETDRVSPLGLGQPDPDRLLENALARAEAGDLDGWLSYFAFSDARGQYFVQSKVAGSSAPQDDQSLERMREWAASFRTVLDQDFVKIDYGAPRSIRNSPPIVAVAFIYDYRFDSLPQHKRAAILERVNSYRPERAHVDWTGFVAWMRSRPSAGMMHFVFIDDAWRFDAMRK